MNEDAVNRIIFSRKDFDSSSVLYSKVALQLQLLLEAGNVCSVSILDEKGTGVKIESSPASSAANAPYPYWLYPDEADYVAYYHNMCEYEKNKKAIFDYENDPLNKEYLKEAQELADLYLREKDSYKCDDDLYETNDKEKNGKNGGNNA